MKSTTLSVPETPLPVPFYLRKYNVSRTTWWRWTKRGLRVMKVGQKQFVTESEFLRFLESNGKPQPQPEEKP